MASDLIFKPFHNQIPGRPTVDDGLYSKDAAFFPCSAFTGGLQSVGCVLVVKKALMVDWHVYF